MANATSKSLAFSLKCSFSLLVGGLLLGQPRVSQETCLGGRVPKIGTYEPEV